MQSEYFRIHQIQEYQKGWKNRFSAISAIYGEITSTYVNTESCLYEC